MISPPPPLVTRAVGLLWLALAAALLGLVGTSGWREVATFSTPLAGRSPNQRHNAVLAARALDGQVLQPGAELSFNRLVGPWTRFHGYRRAPVSYGGEMVMAYGGGVCQTSTTLYNAALLAGLRVAERDHHVWAPRYVDAGRDAAVAQQVADLRLVNVWRTPVRVSVRAEGDQLVARIGARRRPAWRCELVVEPLAAIVAPPRVEYRSTTAGGAHRTVRAGQAGWRVRVWRLWHGPAGASQREVISDDTYRALGPLVRVAGP